MQPVCDFTLLPIKSGEGPRLFSVKKASRCQRRLRMEIQYQIEQIKDCMYNY